MTDTEPSVVTLLSLSAPFPPNCDVHTGDPKLCLNVETGQVDDAMQAAERAGLS